MNQKRNLGLDITRVLAIMLVWVGHSGVFSLGFHPWFMEYWGIVCLEVFFVLSGFLVGKSMLLAITSEEPGTALKGFYVNRILRMIPLYYLLLLVMWAVTKVKPPLLCFLFLQNFRESALDYFPPGWSMPIEAWFYFAVPPVLLLLYRLFSRKQEKAKAVYLSVAVICAVSFLLRCGHVVAADPTWDLGVRKQVLLRLDSPMLGVLMAAMKMYAPEKYRKMGKSILALLAGIGGFLAMYGWYLADLRDNFDDSNLGRIFLFALLPMACCLFVAWMENVSWPEKFRTCIIGKTFTCISTLGYSIYLVHFAVFQELSVYFEGTRFIVSWMGFGLAVVLSLAISYVTWRFIEEPVAKLKDRILVRL